MVDEDNTLLMTVYDQSDLTLWKGNDGLEWTFVRKLLSPSHAVGSFYRNGLYRSCLVRNEKDYRLYFSAYDYDNTYIGLAKSDNPMADLIFIPNTPNHTFNNFCCYAIAEEFRHLKFIITHLLKRK